MSEIKRYTRAEVAERTGRGGTPLWVVIKDSVYDLTNYVNEHPGGTDLITDYGGKEATKDYNSAGHTADADKILPKYKIGEVVEEEKYYDANGKKKKKVVAVKPGAPRSCINIITCGLAG